MSNKILVIGSANVDMVVKTKKFPEPGETILGGTFFKFPGGKGANQAVAAARLDGDVTFIGKLGNDDFGKNLLNVYEEEGINIEHMLVDQRHPTGVALISVNGSGENKIVVAPGANGEITTDEIKNCREIISKANIIILQLEIPLEIVGQIIKLAKNNNVRVILNPAPAQRLPKTYLEKLFLITPNEIEAEKITGIEIKGEDTAIKAANEFHNIGVQNVIITLGSRGVFLSTEDYSGYISTVKVNTVDTTAAGDVFNGAVAVALANRESWQRAVDFACTAAALSVSKNGAQSSAPTIGELYEFRPELAENSNI